MIKKFLRPIIFIIIISLLAIWHISAIYIWPGFLSEFNLVPIIIVSSLFFYNVKSALLASLIFGLWFDLFSFSFFGLESLSLIISIFLIYEISRSWLTNRSIYSFLIINILFVLFYSFTSALLFYFSHFDASGFFLWQKYFWLLLTYRLLWSLILSLIFFSPLTKMTKNLGPGFLDKK